MSASGQKPILAITGATGFVGRHLVEALTGHDAQLRLLVRRAAPETIPRTAQLVHGDLADEQALANLVNGAEMVIHLAGAISARSDREFALVNEIGTGALARIGRAAGVKRFVHMSSLAAREPSLSAYAASKRGAEKRLLEAAGDMGIAIIRAPAIYGPGDKATLPLVQQLVRRYAVIPSTSTARFSLLHVRDIARLAIDSLTQDWTGIREANDGHAEGYGWADLAIATAEIESHPVTPIFVPRAIARTAAGLIAAGAGAMGRAAIVTPGKVRELYHSDWVSREATLRALSPVSLADGLRQTIAWYRQQGWLPRARPVDKRRLRAMKAL